MDYTHSDRLKQVTDKRITELCRTGTQLSSAINSVKVIKISDQFVVKTGLGVSQQEAATLDFVHRHTSSTILRVPRVFRFFTCGSFLGIPIGYIVMEYIPGVTLDKISVHQQSELVPRIARAINHLSEIPCPAQQAPGPVFGGAPRGYLWPENGAGTSFHSMQEMEDWLNRRLQLSSRRLPKLKLHPNALVFSHMDIVRRNILLTPDGQVCVLDWEFAGFYPPYFQRFCLERCPSDDQTFTHSLIQELPVRKDKEQEVILLEIMRINTMRA